jgi:type IV pilus assembly protein PilX
MKRVQEGVTMLVVLVLLSVMLLGGLALARITEIGTLASGNAAYREASLQASEIGLNTAFLAVRNIAAGSEDTNVAGWYWSTMRTTDANGIPAVDFDAAPEVVVGNYSVRYVAERMCNTSPVTDTLQQCLVKQVPQTESSVAGRESIDPPNSRQFRVTVRVTGPKDTQTWIQSLVTKG